MDEPIELTELQLAVMRVLWERGEATVAEVHQELQEERGLAPTTVATLLSRLERREVAARRTEGRQYVYWAKVSEAAVQRSMLREMSERLFGGDVTAMVSQLLGNARVDPEELARIRAMVNAKERELEGQDDV
jgi:BlaI family penicillinase repressor